MKNSIILYIIFSFFFTTSIYAQNNEAVPIHGFFDIDARYIGKESKSKLSTGFLDFYLTKDINDKISILIDLVFETIDNSYAADLERVQITYDVNEYLQITSGKFHTPYGYWNTAFHHGLQIQTSILRPKFIAFEDRGGVLPSHSVGVMSEGFINDFSYNAYVTSGFAIKNDPSTPTSKGIISTNNGEGQDGNKLFGLTLAYNMEDTKVGVHSFYQKVNIFNNTSTDVFMYGAFFAMESQNIELYSELYLFSNKNSEGQFKNKYLQSRAFFVQLAYEYKSFKPYARIETAHYNENDFYFSAQNLTTGKSYDRAALGIAYEIAQDATIKVATIANRDLHSEMNFDFLTQFAIRF